MPDHTELLAGLRSLGRDLDLPATDPAAAAIARIRAGSDRTAPPGAAPPEVAVPIGVARSRRRWLLAAAAAVVVLALVLALPGPRRAAARLLGIGAIQVSTTGDVPPGAAVTELGNFGAPAPVDEAVERSAGAFGDPPVPGLDAPDRAYVGDEAVTLVWDASDRLPELGTTGAGLVVTALRGPGGEPVLRKETAQGTRVTAVSVAGHPGYWVSGASHRVGDRIAGNVLIWADGPVTYRVESALTRDAAIRVGAAI